MDASKLELQQRHHRKKIFFSKCVNFIQKTLGNFMLLRYVTTRKLGVEVELTCKIVWNRTTCYFKFKMLLLHFYNVTVTSGIAYVVINVI